jgi:hypothetical protein
VLDAHVASLEAHVVMQYEDFDGSNFEALDERDVDEN